MPASGVNGVALGSMAVGSIFVWAGIKGYSIPATLKDLVTGKSPANQKQVAPIQAPAATATNLGDIGATSSSVANDALQYVGHSYVYGGAPGPNGTSGWDCSSFVNWVLGHDLGMTLPGGITGYDGQDHGPTTLSYLTWPGATTVGHNGDQAEAGDLCVWQTHMGIALGPDKMISAETESQGTQVSPINGQIPELLFIRRINTVAQVGPQIGPGGKSVLANG